MGVYVRFQHGDEHQRVTLRHSQFSTLKSMQLTRAETNLMLCFLRTPYSPLKCIPLLFLHGN